MSQGGAAADGLYDFQATLQDSGSNTIAGPSIVSAAVKNGLFTIGLDFGSAGFSGADRWLLLGVRTNGAGLFTSLSPRQQLTSTPYAIRAENFGGAVADVQLSTNIAKLNSNQTFSGIIFAGKATNVTIEAHNAGNLLTNVPSLPNVVIGLDVADLLNSRVVQQGTSIGIPDKGAVVWADGSYIQSQNNAHGESAYGSAMRIHNPNSIAILMDGGSPTPFFQFGYSGAANEMFLMQYNDSTRSKVMQWAIYGGAFPGVSQQAVSSGDNTQPFAEWWFWSGYTDQRGVGGGTSHFNGRMLTNGWDFRGRQVYERSTGTAGSIVALDFNGPRCVDLTAGAAAITFYTTNRMSGMTNYEPRVFTLRSQSLAPTLTFPNWTWVSAVPTSLSASNLLRLSLESVGAGESNVIASASSGVDTTFAR